MRSAAPQTQTRPHPHSRTKPHASSRHTPTAPWRRPARAAVATALSVGLVTATAGTASAAQPPEAATTTFTGVLADGAPYLIEMPADFNGTLLLYSHGTTFPGDPETAVTSPGEATGKALLDQGYALAGSGFGTGWAVEEALRDQMELLDVYAATVGAPAETIPWGSSMGGLITGELLERHPDRFSGALPMCGLMGGGVGLWDSYLDLMFVLKTLVDPAITVTGDADPFATVGVVFAALDAAQETPEGRARIALAAAMMDMPGWVGAGTPRPAADDHLAQEQAQVHALEELVVFIAVGLRSDVEQRAGGNPSTNVGVDYKRQLARSVDRAEVRGLYEAAGLSLTTDLRTLAKAPRIAADPGARDYLTQFATFDGNLGDKPVLTLHNAGDTAAPPEHEQAYRADVRRAGDGKFLRQVFVERAGHCTFTPAEMVTTVDALSQRIATGHFPDLSPQALNAAALALGPELNSVPDNDTGEILDIPSEFSDYQPGRFPRQEC